MDTLLKTFKTRHQEELKKYGNIKLSEYNNLVLNEEINRMTAQNLEAFKIFLQQQLDKFGDISLKEYHKKLEKQLKELFTPCESKFEEEYEMSFIYSKGNKC